MYFAKRLSFLTGSGVTLLDGLKIISSQNKSKIKAEIYDLMIRDVSNGYFLSTSMSKLGHFFSPFSIHIIKVGETSGILGQNLEYLAVELARKNELKRKIKSALVYPAFITLATFGITIMLTVYIFPKLLPIFQSIKITLPLSTRILISVSSFIKNYGWWLLAAVLILIAGFAYFHKRSKLLSAAVSFCELKMPIFKNIAKSYALANFCRTTGILLKSGVLITEAVHIAAETSGNAVYRNEFGKLKNMTASGTKLSRLFSENKYLFPDITAQMIAIGERTGNLPDTLMYLAHLHEQEVDEQTKNFAGAIEPVLMMAMGALVGLVAVSIISPIYEITQNLGRV